MAGLAEIVAGCTEADHYQAELAREYREVKTVPELEKEEVREVFAAMGLSLATQYLVADELANDKEQWVAFMMKYELGLDEPAPRRATKSAVNIELSYIIGGLVPLLPYFFTVHPTDGLRWSAVITVCCLFLLVSLSPR